MILDEVFKKAKVIYETLIPYGFIKEEDCYIYTKNIMNDSFLVKLKIDLDGNVSSIVYDNDTNLEYLCIENKTLNGEFVSRVRDEYKKLLLDIKKNCFLDRLFIYEQTNRIVNYIYEKYNNNPLFLWKDDDSTAVFRLKENSKWYGIIMYVEESKVKGKGSLKKEIINVKIDKERLDSLLKIDGIYKAYHMNKKSWISIILDNTLEDSYVKKLIDESHFLVKR